MKNGQNALYVTERAVFKLTENGPMLIEVAKGIDIQKDILDQMEFTPLIAENLVYTDTAMYSNGISGLKALIDAKAN